MLTGILSEEQALMVFGKTVVRKIFGLKGGGGKLRKAAINLHNDELCDRYSSSDILIIKPTRCTDFSNFIFGIKLYMFRTVPLSTIRSFSL